MPWRRRVGNEFKGLLKHYLKVSEDRGVDSKTVLRCGCWMRTRFEIYFQVWIRDYVRKMDGANTLFGILEVIENIYSVRLQGRGFVMWEVILVEMIDNLPRVLLSPRHV